MQSNGYPISNCLPRQSIFGLVLLGLAVGGLVGCGRKTDYDSVNLHGAVTLDGAAVEDGMITFYPAESGKGSGGSGQIEAGAYKLQDVPVGSVNFKFSATKLTGKTVPGPGGQPEPERINPIPRKYYAEGVNRDITDGGSVDFELTTK